MTNINHIKAYLLGLLVGGGKLDSDTFVIDLPFKKWGMDPKRMNIIAIDIITKIDQYFNDTYNMRVTYKIANNKWLIIPLENSNIGEIKNDLEYLGLPSAGFLLNNADLSIVKSKLNGVNINSFLSGIFDTRASLTDSHRRFNASAPVVSIEIPGSTKNFKFVIQLCSWLTDLGSITDQILFNHPNQHSASNPDYTAWKKGFKIRFLVRSFLTQYSFALQAKSIDLNIIEKKQSIKEQPGCLLRKIKTSSPISVHMEQDSSELPLEVRAKLFFHYHHFCAQFNCPFAPVNEIKKLVNNYTNLINFFPKLVKGDAADIHKRFVKIQSSYFPELALSSKKIRISDLAEKEFSQFDGLNQGIAFLFSNSLKGKRHLGSMTEIINNHTSSSITIITIGDTLSGPIFVINPANNRAFICSSVNNHSNQQLIKSKIRIENLTVEIV